MFSYGIYEFLGTPNLKPENNCFWNLFFHVVCPFRAHTIGGGKRVGGGGGQGAKAPPIIFKAKILNATDLCNFRRSPHENVYYEDMFLLF